MSKFETNITNIESLISKGKTHIEHLNSFTEELRTLEDSLRNADIALPFSLEIEAEKESAPKPAKKRHENLRFPVDCYSKKKSWLLRWQKNEQSKKGKFQVFLVEMEIEIIYVLYPEQEYPKPENFLSTVVSEEPLSQTKIAIRTRFSKHLQPFIDAFTKHLDEYCISIEKLKTSCESSIIKNI